MRETQEEYMTATDAAANPNANYSENDRRFPKMMKYEDPERCGSPVVNKMPFRHFNNGEVTLRFEDVRHWYVEGAD